MDEEKLKTVLAWLVLIFIGIPILLSVLGVNLITLLGIFVVIWAATLLVKKYKD